MSKFKSNAMIGAALSALMLVGGAGAAQADATIKMRIINNYGSTIYFGGERCSANLGCGSTSALISNGSTSPYFTAKATFSALWRVDYGNSSYGCRFTSYSNTFASGWGSAAVYKGSGGSQKCSRKVTQRPSALNNYTTKIDFTMRP